MLQLEQQIQQLEEQRQHVSVQLEQLQGCDGGKDDVGVADLKQQLQVLSACRDTCLRAVAAACWHVAALHLHPGSLSGFVPSHFSYYQSNATPGQGHSQRF